MRVDELDQAPRPILNPTDPNPTPMYLLENPVLQRELLVNLRMTRAFVLLFAYVALLGRWWSTSPGRRQQRLDLTTQPRGGQAAGQPVLPGPVRADVADGPELRRRGDHRREGAARPTRCCWPARCGPAAIVLGKLLASLCHLAVLVFCLAADRDALPAAGRRVALRSAGHLRGDGRLGGHVRHDQPGGQQLLHADDRRRWWFPT